MMKRTSLLIAMMIAFLSACNNKSQNTEEKNTSSNTQVANEFIDAFYSFNSDRLKASLAYALESQSGILYYQKWAECGNYEVIRRNDCIVVNDSVIKCPVTVRDDLIGTLGIDFNVTDTFHIKIVDKYIRSVHTSSNDPDMYYEAKEWVNINRPELIKEPCEGIMEGGPTPCECVLAMVQGFKEFISDKHSEQN